MRLEPIGVAVEHRADVACGRAFGIRHRPGRHHEVAHVRVFRPQFQRVLIGDPSRVVASEARQRMAFQSERAGIGDAQGPGLFREPHRLVEIPPAHA